MTGWNDGGWYSDSEQLLTELKRGRRERHAAPSIPGYDEFELIGRGGQGVVFSATQRSTHRRVAIKVLLDGAFASAAARRRFEREVEIVASLEHPGIVRVFDSGTTTDGRLYTVMELLAGVTLDRWADARPAKDAPARDAWIRERCRLIASTGDAVHDAHQRGIIHRDLKPGNIRIDDENRPHVLDFGLAKTLDANEMLGGMTVSRSGHFLGSVPWSSPEQALGAAAAADVRSDLYSLGVIAYQLLTESMPYETDRSLAEALRAVCEAPPAPPRLLGRPLPRDLETVLLKALAKDPARRYQSVGDFVADLRRAVNREPIDARRDSALYVLHMAARRHRTALAGTLFIIAIVLVGSAATFWQWRVAEGQRARADRRFSDVRTLARAFMFDAHDAILELPGSRPARERMVATAMRYLENLAAESDDDPTLQLEIIEGYERIGDMLGSPSMPNLGDTAAALGEYERGLTMLHALESRALADAGGTDGWRDSARNRAISLHNRIGAVLTVQGDRRKAIEEHEKALALLRSAPGSPIWTDRDGAPGHAAARATASRADRGLEASTMMRIGEALAWDQEGENALRRFEAAAAILESLASDADASDRDRFNLQVCVSKVGFMLGQLGRGEEALRKQLRALEISQELSVLQPQNAMRRRSVEINHNQVGAMLLGLGRADEALANFRNALVIGEALAAADPGNRLAQADIAFTRNKIGEALWEAEPGEALPHFTVALDIRRTLAQADPSNVEAQRGVAVACTKVGDANMRLATEAGRASHDRVRVAREHFSEALTVLEALSRAGTLGEVDRGLPDQVRRSVVECDALLGAAAAPAAPVAAPESAAAEGAFASPSSRPHSGHRVAPASR